MMYKIFRFFVFGFSFLMVTPSMHAYTPHLGIVASWIGSLGMIGYRYQAITKSIIKVDNEKWEEEQKKKKMQLYSLSEAEQQVHSDAIKRLKKAGMSGELIEQCMEFGATTELLEELLTLGASPFGLEFTIKNGGTPTMYYEVLMKKITPQDGGVLWYVNSVYHDRYGRKTRFNSKLEYDEYRKKIWDQYKKDRPLLIVLGLTAYATFIDFLVQPPQRYNRNSDFVGAPGPQGAGNGNQEPSYRYQSPEYSYATPEEIAPIPDNSKKSYGGGWDDETGLPTCAIMFDPLKENSHVYYCPWSHVILSKGSYHSLDMSARCSCGRTFNNRHLLEAVFYKEQGKHVSVPSSWWLNFFRKVEDHKEDEKYYIRIPVKNYSCKEGDIVRFCIYSQKVTQVTDDQMAQLSECPCCKSNRRDWQNHLIRNYPITIIDSKPYLKIELKKEPSKEKK